MNFEVAAEKVNKLKSKPSNDELLELYGLYKQGVVGDNSGARPWGFDLKGRAKWDAWEVRRGMSSEDAKVKYIETVEKLIAKYGVDE